MKLPQGIRPSRGYVNPSELEKEKIAKAIGMPTDKIDWSIDEVPA